MISKLKPRIILWYVGLGFLSIIALTWATELLDIPKFLGGEPTPINWRESCIETTLIVLVWIVVHAAITRLLSRLYYLESFIKICAWCRRINYENGWLPLEGYLARGLDVKTSHGICPDCKVNLKADRTAKL